MESGSLAVLALLRDDDDDDEDEDEEEIELPPAQPEINTAQEDPASQPPTSETPSEPATVPSFIEAAGLAAHGVASSRRSIGRTGSRSVEAEAGSNDGQPSNLSTGSK
jgi:hypothetical protein